MQIVVMPRAPLPSPTTLLSGGAGNPAHHQQRRARQSRPTKPGRAPDPSADAPRQTSAPPPRTTLADAGARRSKPSPGRGSGVHGSTSPRIQSIRPGPNDWVSPESSAGCSRPAGPVCAQQTGVFVTALCMSVGDLTHLARVAHGPLSHTCAKQHGTSHADARWLEYLRLCPPWSIPPVASPTFPLTSPHNAGDCRQEIQLHFKGDREVRRPRRGRACVGVEARRHARRHARRRSVRVVVTLWLGGTCVLWMVERADTTSAFSRLRCGQPVSCDCQ